MLQVRNYALKILEGETNIEGRSIEIGDKNTVRFHAYIICELSDDIINTARLFQLQQLPENEGFVGFDPYYRIYYEVIPFEKVIRDAEKRHQMFFDKLGIV